MTARNPSAPESAPALDAGDAGEEAESPVPSTGAPAEIDVLVQDARWTQALPGAETLAIAAARAALAHEGVTDAVEIAVALDADAAVHALNRDYRGKDKPTNVLSFPAAADAPHPGPRHLGDIVLACETVAREAEAETKPLAHHLSHLVVHGVLHLLGYDHQTGAEADAMEARERAILAGLGIPDPYGPAPGGETARKEVEAHGRR